MNNGNPPPFPSLTALRAEHNLLLRSHQEPRELQTLLPQIDRFLRQGQATGVLLDGEQERWTAQSLLDYWTATLLSAGQQPPDAMLRDFDPQLAPELPDALCPYIGLDAFREETSQVFFGRQRLAELLIDKLKTARLLAVVGPSGSGKSSLVSAGLIPALKRGAIPATEGAPGSEQWRYAPRMVPGSEPLVNLARILQSAGEAGDSAAKSSRWLTDQAGQLENDHYHLAAVVEATGDRPVVLFVDQFEELFTLCPDETARLALANNLLALTQTHNQRHTVILTMRTDFESFIMRLPGFQPFFEQAVVRVTPLNASELREAILNPAEAVGLKFEEGVVDALLQDILGEPAALPLLQFTLLKLWEHRERNRITWAAYRRLGGGRLALARSADDLYDSLIPEEQLTARRILLRLVRPGEGLEVTSNRIRRDTLYGSGEARDRVDRVLQKLIAARLIRLSEGDAPTDLQVEVAHEALVRNWPRLVEWLEQEREHLRDRVRLTEAATQWEKVNRDPGALLRGALLDEAQRYTDLNQVEAEYVRASQAARVAAEQARETARLRELEAARALAEEQRQRADLERQRGEDQAMIAATLRRRAVLLSVISIIAVLLAGVAAVSGWIARQSLGVAVEQRATAQAAEAIAGAARQTAIAERDQGLITQATLASNLEILLAAQADAARTIASLSTSVSELQDAPDSPATPTPAAGSYRATPTPVEQIAPITAAGSNQSYEQARIDALGYIDNFRAREATATALPTPVAQIVETAKGATSSTVRDNLVFHVQAFDPSVGQGDGAGIEFVELQILDNGGNIVWSKAEYTPGYCAFGGGEPNCNVYVFAENGNRWPDENLFSAAGAGEEIRSGEEYTLRAIVYTLSGTRTQVEQQIVIML